MGWNYDRSRERIAKHAESIGEIQVSKLVRDADLEKLLSETECRNIYSAHVYVDVSNFATLASAEPTDVNDYKRMIQALHLYQREVSRIVQWNGLFDAVRVHFQGSRLHALLYRPIDEGDVLTAKAVLLQLVLKDFARNVFNPEYPDLANFTLHGGADIGNVIGTQDGKQGDRELLFIGPAANHAAKLIVPGSQMRVTKELYDALPDDLQELCLPISGSNAFKLEAVSSADLDDLLDQYGIEWDRDSSQERLEQDRKDYPMSKIEYSDAEAPIDLSRLSISNNKRILAASIFADVSGFTHFVDAAESDDEKEEALRLFHLIRKEMARVVEDDFGGLRVQFQGDRVQGIYHLPKDDERAIAQKVVEAAIGLQSSMEETLRDYIPASSNLHLAIGSDLGTTLISRLGMRADRDPICLGEPAAVAAQLQERTDDCGIAISRRVYDALPESMQPDFAFDAKVQGYVTYGLTARNAAVKALGCQMDRNQPVAVGSTGPAIVIGGREPEDKSIRPARRWCPDG